MRPRPRTRTQQTQTGFLDNDALIIVALIIGLGIVWFVTGGPERWEAREPFIYPLPPVGSGGVYGIGEGGGSGLTGGGSQNGGGGAGGGGETGGEVEGGQVVPAPYSPYRGDVTLSRGNASREDEPQREYIEIRYAQRADGPVEISGWTLQNSGGIAAGTTNPGVGDEVSIGLGTEFPENTGTNQRRPIVLQPGDRAVVTTGKAPDVFPAFFRTNFRENVCLGYVEDAFEFTPGFSGSCPTPRDFPGVDSVDDQCYEFVQNRVRSCEIPDLDDIQRADLGNACRLLLNENFNYAGCISSWQHAPGFFLERWRIFLGHSGSELWRNARETISLFDAQGRLVDRIFYD